MPLPREADHASVDLLASLWRCCCVRAHRFAIDSDKLQAEARDNLASLVASLEDYVGTKVLVVGHTDSSGALDHNQDLSERRAESARSFLIESGLEDARVRSEGFGEAQPVDTNDTAEGRQANRRVEVAIFASEELQEELLRRHGG